MDGQGFGAADGEGKGIWDTAMTLRAVIKVVIIALRVANQNIFRATPGILKSNHRPAAGLVTSRHHLQRRCLQSSASASVSAVSPKTRAPPSLAKVPNVLDAVAWRCKLWGLGLGANVFMVLPIKVDTREMPCKQRYAIKCNCYSLKTNIMKSMSIKISSFINTAHPNPSVQCNAKQKQSLPVQFLAMQPRCLRPQQQVSTGCCLSHRPMHLATLEYCRRH
jgi:hypothetical protein